jgi:hypothetical protein
VSATSVIDNKWEWMLTDEDPVIRLTVSVAIRYPSLRCLYPFASLQNLWFSHKVEYPYDWDPPHVRYDDGQFHAMGRGMVVLLIGNVDAVVACVAAAMEELHRDGGGRDGTDLSRTPL